MSLSKLSCKKRKFHELTFDTNELFFADDCSRNLKRLKKNNFKPLGPMENFIKNSPPYVISYAFALYGPVLIWNGMTLKNGFLPIFQDFYNKKHIIPEIYFVILTYINPFGSCGVPDHFPEKPFLDIRKLKLLTEFRLAYTDKYQLYPVSDKIYHAIFLYGEIFCDFHRLVSNNFPHFHDVNSRHHPLYETYRQNLMLSSSAYTRKHLMKSSTTKVVGSYRVPYYGDTFSRDKNDHTYMKRICKIAAFRVKGEIYSLLNEIHYLDIPFPDELLDFDVTIKPKYEVDSANWTMDVGSNIPKQDLRNYILHQTIKKIKNSRVCKFPEIIEDPDYLPPLNCFGKDESVFKDLKFKLDQLNYYFCFSCLYKWTNVNCMIDFLLSFQNEFDKIVLGKHPSNDFDIVDMEMFRSDINQILKETHEKEWNKWVNSLTRIGYK